jgi:hypothetical protein
MALTLSLLHVEMRDSLFAKYMKMRKQTMKAQNLTVSLPYKGCDKDPQCPYCISKITGYVDTNLVNMRKNIPKVINMLNAVGVTSVLLTSKGEPFMKPETVYQFTLWFNEFPVEIQTNGLWLNDNTRLTDGAAIRRLAAQGASVIAFSIDDLSYLYDYRKMFELIHETGMITRVCLNVTDLIPKSMSFKILLDGIKLYSIQQLLVRRISYPSNAKPCPQVEWIDQYTSKERYEELYREMHLSHPKLVRVLPHGAEVFDIDGVSVSFSDWCIQESNQTEDIRSLIMLEDGHVYTSWSDKGSILF